MIAHALVVALLLSPLAAAPDSPQAPRADSPQAPRTLAGDVQVEPCKDTLAKKCPCVPSVGKPCPPKPTKKPAKPAPDKVK